MFKFPPEEFKSKILMNERGRAVEIKNQKRYEELLKQGWRKPRYKDMEAGEYDPILDKTDKNNIEIKSINIPKVNQEFKQKLKIVEVSKNDTLKVVRV